jgi:uncharacterized GH25 family protein
MKSYRGFTSTALRTPSPTAVNEGYKHAVGLPIEIVPEKDPLSLKSGEALPVRVLLRGEPARDLAVLAESSRPGYSTNHEVGRTGADGRIAIPVAAGQWRLHTIHMERSANPDAEWESFWATLTFEVR